MKKLIKIAFVAVFAAVAGYGVYTNQKSETMSDLMLANVEALANGEMNVGDLVDNCVWLEFSYCYYIVVTPNENVVWQHWNMKNN
ncbi:NVEALA domain-containing protein [Bacteroides fluxus]|uniref:NVEALA domain-containing protein n=1 Tax=Bacteroides fluxus TaxID=626930 RepID=UPI0023A7E600|nr:NVEALA domain-containing protein [Bacteroides fluxus]